MIKLVRPMHLPKWHRSASFLFGVMMVCCSHIAAADDLRLNSADGPDENSRVANARMMQNHGASVLKSQLPTALPAKPHTSAFAISESQARSSVQWLAELAIKKSPRTYDGDKDWGKTKSVFSGIKFSPKGLRLNPKRREKDLRHGRWVKYELTLPSAKKGDQKANADGLVATIHRVSRNGDLPLSSPFSDQSNTHWEIESSVETPMTFTARVERWNLGVQLYSISVKGKMRVRLDSTTSLAFLADYGEVPPAFVIDPKILNSELHLKEFEVDRVSKIGGDAAEEWGELMEKVVRDVFLAKQNEKLTSKLNKSINKHRDDLRLSMSDWLKTW